MCKLYKTANKSIYQSILNFKYGNYFSDKGLEQKYTIHYTEIKRTQKEKEIYIKKNINVRINREGESGGEIVKERGKTRKKYVEI